MPDIPNSQDAIARAQAALTSVASAAAEDVKNKATNTVKNEITSAALTALPPPLNAAAQGLGNALFAAFKVPLNPVILPVQPNADPVKALAFSIAFAIIKLIWCLIKSLLNPLPIIGSFFPLCSETSTELTNADNEFSNLTNNEFVNQRVRSNLEASGVNQANVLESKTKEISGNTEPDVQGITFDEFLKKNAIGSGEETEQEINLKNIQPNGGNDVVTSSQVEESSQTAQAAPQWEASEQTFDEVRRRFGL
jgi:hypothetical protein